MILTTPWWLISAQTLVLPCTPKFDSGQARRVILNKKINKSTQS